MQRIERTIDTLAYTALRRVSTKLPQVEFLSEIWLDVSGTMTITLNGGTAVIKQEGPHALVNTAQVTLNGYLKLGNVSPFTLSGYLTSILNRIDRPGYTDNFTAAVAAGANTWSFHLRVPITATDVNMAGIIFTGMPGSQVTLFLQWGQESDVITLAGGAVAAFVGQANIRTITFQVADNEGFDIFSLHAITQQTDVVTATGVKAIDLPPGNLYLRILHAVRNNTLYANAVATQLQLEIQNYADPITVPEDRALSQQRWRYLTDLPVGSYCFDLFWTRTLRDAIDTGKVNKIQSKVTMAAAVATCDIQTAIEQYVPIPRPSKAAA